MKNSSSLVTVAMLTSFLSNENKHYLDLLVPFVLKSLPSRKKKLIDINTLSINMKNDFGFEDLPHNIYKILLKRISRKYDYISKHNNNYYVEQIYDISEFEKNHNQISNMLDKFIDKLMGYYNDENYVKRKSKQQITEMFMNFLEYYGYSVLNDKNNLKEIIKDSDNKENYYVAQFIINEYEKKSIIYNHVVEIVKGFFVYKSIYFFSTDKKKTFESKLKGTSVYIDTRIAINALGYDTEEDKIAAIELIELINESGGKAKIFKHNIDEIKGILKKYAEDISSRATMRLNFFDEYNYDREDVLRVREYLEEDLRKIDLQLDYGPDLSATTDENLSEKGYIDFLGLKKCLKDNYQEINKNPREEAIDNDVKSMLYVSIIRGSKIANSIEDCKAIFVTDNNLIIRTVNNFFSNRFNDKKEISFIINDIDITALLWLRSFDKKSNIPSHILLENAYSAIKPSKELIEVFNDKVQKLEKEGSITKQKAIILRTNFSVRKNLVRITKNDPNSIDDKLIKDIEKQYDKKITDETEEKYKKIIRENEMKEKEKQRKVLDGIRKNCKDSSKKICAFIRAVANGAIGLILLLIIFYAVNHLLEGFRDNNKLLIIGAGIIADGLLFIEVNGLFFKTKRNHLKRIENKIYDYKYKKEIVKLRKYNPNA